MKSNILWNDQGILLDIKTDHLFFFVHFFGASIYHHNLLYLDLYVLYLRILGIEENDTNNIAFADISVIYTEGEGKQIKSKPTNSVNSPSKFVSKNEGW